MTCFSMTRFVYSAPKKFWSRNRQNTFFLSMQAKFILHQCITVRVLDWCQKVLNFYHFGEILDLFRGRNLLFWPLYSMATWQQEMFLFLTDQCKCPLCLNQWTLVILLCYSMCDKQSNYLPKETFTQFGAHSLQSTKLPTSIILT